MLLLELIFEGLFELVAHSRPRWLLLPLGIAIAIAGVVLMSTTMAGGIAVVVLGVLTLAYGVFLLGKGDE